MARIDALTPKQNQEEDIINKVNAKEESAIQSKQSDEAYKNDVKFNLSIDSFLNDNSQVLNNERYSSILNEIKSSSNDDTETAKLTKSYFAKEFFSDENAVSLLRSDQADYVRNNIVGKVHSSNIDSDKAYDLMLNAMQIMKLKESDNLKFGVAGGGARTENGVHLTGQQNVDNFLKRIFPKAS